MFKPKKPLSNWQGLIVLAIPMLVLSIDASAPYIALPELSMALHATNVQQLWIIDIYPFLIAGCLMSMSALGSRIGHRKLLLSSAALFGCSSLLAAFAKTPEILVIARLLMGIAGAALTPSIFGLVRLMFPHPRQLGRAIAILTCCFMIGMISGPLAGGFLLQYFWWGSVFLIGAPLMLLVMLSGLFLLPNYHHPRNVSTNFVSALLGLATILLTIYAIKEFAQQGFSLSSLVGSSIGLVCGVFLVWRQTHLDKPMIDLHLFKHRGLGVALWVEAGIGIVTGGLFLFMSLYLQLVAHLSPLATGLRLLPQAIAMVAGLLVASSLAHKIRPNFVMVAGFICAAAGQLLLLLTTSQGGVSWLITGSILLSFGAAMPLSLATSLIFCAAPPARANITAELSEVCGELGAALGVAILGSIGAILYRQDIARQSPNDSMQQVTENFTSGLSSSIDVAYIAQATFTHIFHVLTLIGVCLFLGLALFAGFKLSAVPLFKDSAPD